MSLFIEQGVVAQPGSNEGFPVLLPLAPAFTAPIGKPLYRRAPGLFVLLSGTSFQAFHALLRALESELGPCVTQWDHPQSLWLELLDLWSLLAAQGGP